MSNMDPQPGTTPGLEAGAGVRPGDTPPAEGSTSGTSYREPNLRGKGWGPVPVTLVIVAGLVVAAMLITMAVVLAM